MQSKLQLEVEKNKAEKASKAKEEFLAHMSHEIRTPLNAILGLSQLLRQDYPDKAQQENVAAIEYAADNLHLIINDILDISKIEAGKMDLIQENVNLKNLLRQILKLHQPEAKQKGIDLVLDMKKEITSFVVTDRLKLTQILNNLISNALKFTREGKVVIQLSLHSKQGHDIWIDFSVEDTGIGIPKEKLPVIFDVFGQADSSTSRKYGGTGLGLTLCRLYLEMMGSEIKVESRQGKGSRFYFTLHVQEGSEKKTGISQPATKKKKLSENLKLLLVEDSDLNRMVLSQFLRKWEVNFLEASDGKEAISLFGYNDFDIILMDIRMPGMDGIETANEIRKLPGEENTIIIALTADISQAVRKKVETRLFNDYLLKPVNPDLLFDKLAIADEEIMKKKAEENQRDENRESIDTADLLEMMHHDQKAVNKFLEKSLENSRKIKDSLQELVESQDAEGISDLKHKHTTMFRILNAEQLMGTMKNIEDQIKENAGDDQLKKATDACLQQIDQFIKKLESSFKEV